MALAVLLLGPLLAVTAITVGPVSPAAALTPAPIPGDLWDPAPPADRSWGYAIVEGGEGDPVTGGQDFVITAAPGAAFGPEGEDPTTLVSLVYDDGEGFGIRIGVPPGEPRLEVGYYPTGSGMPAVPGHVGIEIWRIGPGSSVGRCSGAVTGWVAIDHIREVDGQIGELDYRVEQSCDGAAPLRAEVHLDVLLESIYGPDPIPDGLWDEKPEFVTSDYIYLDGVAGDPVVGDRDLLHIGAVSTTLAADDYPALVVGMTTSSGFWTGEFWGHVEDLPPVAGFYPQATSLADRTFRDPAFGWWNAVAGSPCADVTGWFAIDRITRAAGKVIELDLRFEQSCDGAPPIHGRVHLDDSPPPTNPQPIPSDLWDVTPPDVAGDYFFIDGEVGDLITNGSDHVIQPLTRRILGDSEGQLHVVSGLSSDDFWWVRLDGGDPDGLVQPGFYANLAAPASATPRVEGISVRHANAPLDTCPDGRTGWFAVDSVSRVDGLIRQLDARFQQRCEGAAPLHGRVHFDQGGLPVGPPVGALESVSLAQGGVKVDGWALDPETVAAIDVSFTLDGAPASTVLANQDRPDIAALHPLYGAAHGFSTTLAVPTGTHQVCANARNVATGTDTVLGCRTVTVGSGSPTGSFDAAKAIPGGVSVAGWALDPDTAAAIPVHVYVDSKGVALTANGNRPDVGSAYPGYGPSHGFSATIPSTPGAHQVCAYAINVGAGSNTLLGCRVVTVPSGPPIGSLDAARGVPGGVTLGGWALDPDTAASIPVHVYVGSKGVALTADGNRPDVGAFFQGYGSAHGFNATISAPPGVHQVCAYGINTGPGATSVLGCKTVVVPGGSPFGTLDVAVGGAGKVTVGGWAIDPDTSASIPIHVYVANAGTAITAGGNRPDVAAAFPGYGAAHGYNAVISATPGTKQVCAYAINSGIGGTTLLGCRTVTIT